MCGIFILYTKLGFRVDQPSMHLIDEDCKLMDHRGDTGKKYIVNNKLYMYHRRLAIMDTSVKGIQPFFNAGVFLAANGEIYNHQALRQEVKEQWPKGVAPYVYKSASDCEVAIPLYKIYGSAFVRKIQGMFSFALVDLARDILLVSRDHIGMTSLYMANGGDTVAFSSEMKCLTRMATERGMTVSNFKPGHVFVVNMGKESPQGQTFAVDTANWRQLPVADMRFRPHTLQEQAVMRDIIETSVRAHTVSDAPWGVLLSGGLDSSIVAAIAAKSSPTPISTFTIGLENSVDVAAADVVADFIKSNHTAYTFDLEDAIAVLEDVVAATETYDITTIRASIPLYILTMFIKEDTPIKTLLSGEVADEIFAGYAYFKHAPSAEELFMETVDKVNALHKYDCLRAHKAALANTIEVRVPFGHRPVVDFVMNIDPAEKMSGGDRIEKHILREAFKHMLPEQIWSRPKEQFSDGVSGPEGSLIDALKAYASEQITDAEVEHSSSIWPTHTPITKEGMLYRKIFEKVFPLDSQITTVDHNIKSIACSTERALAWMNVSQYSPVNDPSGKSVPV